MKTITVETNNGVRRMRVPDDALTNTGRTPANQLNTGVYQTDVWASPRGNVIALEYSCWVDGRGACRGWYYRLVEDDAERIALDDAHGLGLAIETVEA